MSDYEKAGKFTRAQATKKLHELQFFFVPSGKNPINAFIVKFMAFITQLEDEYTADWATTPVYGRMDPIATFQGTTRKINLAWTVPAYSGADAKNNLRKMSKLIAMCYPVYGGHASTPASSKGIGAGSISGSPLIKLKFGNLITSLASGNSGTSDVIKNGLLGWIDGISFAPNIEAGFYDPKPGELYPMQIDLNCTFYVLHQHQLGWGPGQNGIALNTRNFPYGATYDGGNKKVEVYPDPCPEGTEPLTVPLEGAAASEAGAQSKIECVSPPTAESMNKQAAGEAILSTPK